VEEAPVESYADREGFREDSFLEDGLAVKRPRLTAALEADVLHPVSAEGTDGYVVHYTNFSLVMCSSRRMCFYSAVNIDGKESVSIRGRRPRWRKDSRLLPLETQIQHECYGDERYGKFSRGHMTRREDPNWGPQATKANDDTFHVTNACPQMQPFNAGIWLGLEDYALENARQDEMRICVFTGPVLGANDPDYFGVKVPEWFWKVIAFIHDETGELTATGYKMDQRDVLPGEEFVYGRHGCYQTSLKEIEALTGLSFGELVERDPYRVVEEAPATPLLSFDQVRFT
ncbi:MAG: DNA/RNA non-specific endonuclease, partial [Acidobacteriota bacterium]|nr:DNA/RNA non-specific endonuclease [Acidobacteriota bacterium]